MAKKRRRLMRMVVHRDNLARSVDAELEMSDSEEIRAGIREFFAPGLAASEGEIPPPSEGLVNSSNPLAGLNIAVPDPREWVEFGQLMLRYYTWALTEADADRVVGMVKDVELRIKRDELMVEVGEAWESLGNTLSGLFGPQALNRFALSEKLAETAAGIHRQAELSAKLLREDSGEGLTQNWPVGEIELSAFALELEKKNEKLDAILKALDRDDRETQSTVVRKQGAVGEWDDKYLRLARFFESFYRLANLDEKAKRFRPLVRQVGRAQRDVLDIGDPDVETEDETAVVESAVATPEVQAAEVQAVEVQAVEVQAAEVTAAVVAAG
jgi:hypothetical protein